MPFLLPVVLAVWFVPCALRGADSFYAKIYRNGEDKGEFLVHLRGDRDFLVRSADFPALGLPAPTVPTEEIDGEPYVPLKSVGGLTFLFNEGTLSLEITADPVLLPKRAIDFLPPRQPGVLFPKDTSGFVNYGITYEGGSAREAETVNVTGQAGARKGDFLFLTDGTYGRTDAVRRFVRLDTSVTRDWRENLQRLVAGDHSASSGSLGSALSLGGLGFSKVYRMDPYFLRYPLATVSGMVSLPSEAEVYLGGTRIRTEKLHPGPFELRNVSSIGGRNLVSVVIRDPFGREQRISYPFYFTDVLLGKGLHEYGYSAGFLRERFGEESNRYGAPAFVAFHNYGVSDALTVGGRGEGSRETANLGPVAVFRIRDAGIASFSFAGSANRGGGGGAAGEASHTFQGAAVNTRLFLKWQTRRYAVVADEVQAAADKSRFEIAAGAGYGSRRAGSLSADVESRIMHSGPDRRTAALGYSRTVRDSVSAILSFRRTWERERVNELFAGLTYYPWQESSFSASYRRTGDIGTETLEARKNLPAGEGWGYRVPLERTDSPSLSTTVAAPSVQYNARFGSYAAEYRGVKTEPGGWSGSHRLSAYGAAAFVEGDFGFGRPIPDSFGVVTVGGLEGVRVYHNNQEMGRTDSRGKLFLPSLGSYYENQVSIADKDVPIEYSIREVKKVVSPPLRSGSRISFEANRFQAVTGRLGMRLDGTVSPAEYLELRVTGEGRERVFPTGKGGEFFMEELRPGTYLASVEHKGKRCSLGLRVPQSHEMIIDLGEVTCEESR
ncbi:MAG: fimbrial biogenesis outer membrane usher protein [Deltaproteobacteria bacterium]|nr:fimbrial biogenesis outer membrane usher protein [Deltaproteobacteria bacterium]